jgi:hypothetical protein
LVWLKEVREDPEGDTLRKVPEGIDQRKIGVKTDELMTDLVEISNVVKEERVLEVKTNGEDLTRGIERYGGISSDVQDPLRSFDSQIPKSNSIIDRTRDESIVEG